MIKLVLESNNGNIVIYRFQPEGKGEFGKVEYNRKGRKASIIKAAEESSLFFSNKVLYKIKEIVEDKHCPEKYMIAWH
ncbi:MAG: hypothetical protein LBD23_18950 [Oscillospiraceae bacterium]|jgi:hypothetical protein|nr:hypothetical protein [Oscillospiraceae bacterium]